MSYLEDRLKRKNGILPPLPTKKEKKPVAKKSDKKLKAEAEERAAGTDKPVDEYFSYHMAHSEPVCQNCKMEARWLLLPEYESVWRMCHHHVLAKRKTQFPSLAGNLDNHLVLFPSLGGKLCGCHGWAESNWFNATTMECWPLIVEVFKKVYPMIPEKEKKNIPEQLVPFIPLSLTV